MDPSNPLASEYLEVMKQIRTAYESPERPMPEFSEPEHMPPLPKELQMLNNDLNRQISNIVQKAIVSGDAYTIEQAMKDIRDVWDKSNGKQLEEWYLDWYKNNKDRAFMAKDFYKYLAQPSVK